MQQFSNLIEFRQTVYDHVLTRARDAQFELVDALLLSAPIHTFPELSRSPTFRREWHSAYTAVEDGRQDRERLECYLTQLLPPDGCLVFSLDSTAWSHTAARTLPDRQYVYSASDTGLGSPVVVGHPYSVLAWAPERNTSWAPPLSIRRVLSQKTDVEVGVEQVKQLCRDRWAEMLQTFHLIVADGKYGNHSFLGPLKEEPCGVLARMRCDQVLHQTPGEYSGKGRPRVHGERFAFKEPETWDEPQETVAVEDEKWGTVRLRRWDGLHARQDANTVFSVLLVEAPREREVPAKPFWLAYQPPTGRTTAGQPLAWLPTSLASGARYPVSQTVLGVDIALFSGCGRLRPVDPVGQACSVSVVSGSRVDRRSASSLAASAGETDTRARSSGAGRSFQPD